MADLEANLKRSKAPRFLVAAIFFVVVSLVMFAVIALADRFNGAGYDGYDDSNSGSSFYGDGRFNGGECDGFDSNPWEAKNIPAPPGLMFRFF